MCHLGFPNTEILVMSYVMSTRTHKFTSVRVNTNMMQMLWLGIYRQISSIRRCKSQNLNVSRLVLQLSLSSPPKPGIKSGMKMQLEQRNVYLGLIVLSSRVAKNFVFIITG